MLNLLLAPIKTPLRVSKLETMSLDWRHIFLPAEHTRHYLKQLCSPRLTEWKGVTTDVTPGDTHAYRVRGRDGR